MFKFLFFLILGSPEFLLTSDIGDFEFLLLLVLILKLLEILDCLDLDLDTEDFSSERVECLLLLL